MSAVNGSPPDVFNWIGTSTNWPENFTVATNPIQVQRNDPVQTFNETWAEFRKMFGPVLLDNNPIIRKFNLKYGFREFNQPEIEVELKWVPKKIQRRMF